jgi:hypothetical protein
MPNPEKGPEQAKSIEMRLAEIEDKLSKLHVTEEEMKAYEKVSTLLGGTQGVEAVGTAGAGTALSPQFCQISRFRGITPRSIVPRQIVRQIFECYECSCGPCGGGGFGSFGQ